jgi:predicted TPR repeat methyltransferase
MRFGSNLRHLSLAALVTACLAGSASAQVGRVGGIVRDDKGDTIKGAIISAENASIASSFTATTDEKGRFTMVGLRPGTWRFMAQANGHAAQAGEMNVRWGSPNPPMSFTLRRTGPGTTGTLAGVAAKDLQAELAAADQLFNQHKWDEAVAAYRRIMAKTPSLSVINLQIAAAFRSKKDFDSAIDAYHALLTADPDNERAKIGIALTNLERGDTKAAEAALQEAANNPAAGRDVFFNLGEVKSTAGDVDEAAKWYARASAVDPSWGKPLHRLGMLALQKGDTSNAAKYLNQVMSVDPVSAEAALAKATLDQLNK